LVSASHLDPVISHL
ncbi:hypothetical protein BAE44_0000176, partial [Dichanthelium oligosanthes]